MAHLEKYTQADYPKLLMHYERAKNTNGEYHKFRNQDIDLSRTDQNYNVAAGFQTLSQSEFMDKRLGQLKIFKRGDVKYLCDWVVTLPKGMEPEERRFFDEVFRFLSDKYGRKNIVSAYVHKDEARPHMHFAFVPVAMDEKKNREKLCSKDIIGRDDMLAFHDELDAYMTGVFGYDTGVRNGATVEGNKSIAELKRGTAVKELNAKREELAAVESTIDDLKCGDRIEPVKEKRDVVVISKADFETAGNALTKVKLSDKKMREGQAEVKKGVDYRNQIFRQSDEIQKLKAEISSHESENRRLNNRLLNIQNVFERNPRFLESFLQFAKDLERERENEERALQAAKRKQRQLEKGEMEM